MQIKHLSFLAVALLLTLSYGCQKDRLSLDSPPAINNIDPPKDIMAALTDLERAQFSQPEIGELEQLLSPVEDQLRLRTDDVIEVPAGSVDALATAIESAGEDAIILLKAGDHFERGTVTLSKRLTIFGEPGAIWHTNTSSVAVVGQLEPALHILDVAGAVIRGISFESETPSGGVAILLENAPRTRILRNSLVNHEAGVVVERSDRVIISGNTIQTSLDWTTSAIALGFGIVVVNGKNARIVNNEITSSLFGVWACDGAGWYLGNTTQGNLIGLILCKVPDNSFPLPTGAIAGSAVPGNNWLVLHNTSYGNLDAGYLVIDGAFKNFLSSNKAESNGTYDIELVGVTERFGFVAPTSANNRVYTSSGIVVKDCGLDNAVYGGDQVDNTLDPCF